MPVYTEVEGEYQTLGVGTRIRQMRKQRGVTLSEMARQLSISIGSLSAIENDNLTLDVGLFLAIAQALEAPTEKLLPLSVTRHFHIMRRGWLEEHPPAAIKVIDRARGKSTSYHNRLWPLAQPFVGKYIEPYAAKIECIAGDQLRFITHHHEEFVYVLQGQVECLIKTPDGLQAEQLSPGDCIYFWSYLPHVTRSLGSGPALCLHLVHSPHEPADSEFYNDPTGGLYLIDTSSHKDVMEQIIGRVISIRQRHGLSLAECATALGISVRRLRKIESGEAALSIELLLRLCRTFRKPREYFLASTLVERPFSLVTRAAEIENQEGTPDLTQSFHNAVFKPLSNEFRSRGMQPYLIQLRKSDAPSSQLQSLAGQLFVYVLAGAVKLRTQCNGELVDEMLFAGDSCFTDSSFPHQFDDASFHPHDAGSKVIAVEWSARQFNKAAPPSS